MNRARFLRRTAATVTALVVAPRALIENAPAAEAVEDPFLADLTMSMAAPVSALTASGGLCAPITPFYGLQMLSVSDRPIRKALPSFRVPRDGDDIEGRMV